MPTDLHHDPAHLRRLATLLAMPEQGALEALREIAPDVSWLNAALESLERLPLEHWQAEHTRLFVAGYPKTPCPPFESAYRQRQMSGAFAQDLQGLYQRAGLEAREIPADYLGAELELAAFLLDQRRDDSTGCLVAELERELWEDHLGRWLPRFARDLIEHAQLPLYRLLGEQLAWLCPEPEIADEQ